MHPASTNDDDEVGGGDGEREEGGFENGAIFQKSGCPTHHHHHHHRYFKRYIFELCTVQCQQLMTMNYLGGLDEAERWLNGTTSTTTTTK